MFRVSQYQRRRVKGCVARSRSDAAGGATLLGALLHTSELARSVAREAETPSGLLRDDGGQDPANPRAGSPPFGATRLPRRRRSGTPRRRERLSRLRLRAGGASRLRCCTSEDNLFDPASAIGSPPHFRIDTIALKYCAARRYACEQDSVSSEDRRFIFLFVFNATYCVFTTW